MTKNAVEKIKDAFEGMLKDRRLLVRILSIILILLIAVIMRIHEAGRADVTIESADDETAAELGSDEETGTGGETSILFVDIGGAVAEPGVYQVAAGTRLYQVIDMAGGLTEDADTDSVNRASFVEDGQKIIIPVKGSANTEGTSAPAAGTASAETGGLININTASADELKTLSGIGEAIAGRIIEYRSSHAFKSKEDIMSVDGIGSKTYDKIKDRITV